MLIGEVIIDVVVGVVGVVGGDVVGDVDVTFALCVPGALRLVLDVVVVCGIVIIGASVGMALCILFLVSTKVFKHIFITISF